MAAAGDSTYQWPGAGTLLFAGGTDWAMLGRTKEKKKTPQEEAERERLYPNFSSPVQFKNLIGVKISFIAAGAAAVHCIAGDENGRVYTWGRNEKGQLGHGDLTNRNMPTVVATLAHKKVVGGCGGRFHSAFITQDGESYTCGTNLMGQCGTGSVKKNPKEEELIKSPVKALISEATAVTCGVDFTLWIAGGHAWACGSPQYGQLGDGSDHVYNAKDSSIKLMYEPQPTPKMIPALATKTIIALSAGHNHAVAVDNEGSVYTWGSGNYGKLGHRVQKDEFTPKKVAELSGRLAASKNPVLAAASNASFVTSISGQMFFWGKTKTSGDNTMYPAAEMNLQGWNVRHMSCSSATYGVAADRSVIIWGQATNGELGYGDNGKKSSANPAKCDALEGMYTAQVACGNGFSMFLVDGSTGNIDKFKVFESEAQEAKEAPAEAGTAKGGKGKAPAKPAVAKGESSKGKAASKPAPAAKGKGKAKAQVSDDEDDDATEDDDVEEEEEEAPKAKAGAKRKAAPAAPAKGRGRPKKAK